MNSVDTLNWVTCTVINGKTIKISCVHGEYHVYVDSFLYHSTKSLAEAFQRAIYR